MLPSRPFLLRSQIFFAYIMAIPLVFLTVISIPAIVDAPYIPLFFLACAIIGHLLCQHWKRAITDGSMALGEHIVSITFWALPFLASLAVTAGLIVEELVAGPQIFNDWSFHPIQFIGFSIVGVLWFSLPLACSILVARTDALHRNTQPTPA